VRKIRQSNSPKTAEFMAAICLCYKLTPHQLLNSLSLYDHDDFKSSLSYSWNSSSKRETVLYMSHIRGTHYPGWRLSWFSSVSLSEWRLRALQLRMIALRPTLSNSLYRNILLPPTTFIYPTQLKECRLISNEQINTIFIRSILFQLVKWNCRHCTMSIILAPSLPV